MCKRDGVERRWTLLEYYRECLNAARSLIALGVQPKRGVALLGFNAPEWFFGAVGGIFAGYVKSLVTTLYFVDKLCFLDSQLFLNLILEQELKLVYCIRTLSSVKVHYRSIE